MVMLNEVFQNFSYDVNYPSLLVLPTLNGSGYCTLHVLAGGLSFIFFFLLKKGIVIITCNSFG